MSLPFFCPLVNRPFIARDASVVFQGILKRGYISVAWVLDGCIQIDTLLSQGIYAGLLNWFIFILLDNFKLLWILLHWITFVGILLLLLFLKLLHTFAYFRILFMLLPTYSWFAKCQFGTMNNTLFGSIRAPNDSVNFRFLWRGNTLYCFSVSPQLKQINLNC